MKCLKLLQEQTKLDLFGKCQLWSALVPALADTTWLQLFAVLGEEAPAASTEPVRATAVESEEETCYTKKTKCVTDIELLFPDMQEKNFV